MSACRVYDLWYERRGAAAEDLAGLYAVVRPHLDERQRRVLLGAGATRLGRGGIKTVVAAARVHPDTVARGPGGGRAAGAAGAGARCRAQAGDGG